MLDLAIDNKLFINTKMDAALQELDILFNTEIGEIIGSPSYGANWYQFLYVLTPMESELQRYVDNLINSTYYCSKMLYSVKVKYVSGEATSSYIVSITIQDPDADADDPNKTINKIYNIK
jgi:hypothetical protein